MGRARAPRRSAPWPRAHRCGRAGGAGPRCGGRSAPAWRAGPPRWRCAPGRVPRAASGRSSPGGSRTRPATVCAAGALGARCRSRGAPRRVGARGAGPLGGSSAPSGSWSPPGRPSLSLSWAPSNTVTLRHCQGCASRGPSVADSAHSRSPSDRRRSFTERSRESLVWRHENLDRRRWDFGTRVRGCARSERPGRGALRGERASGWSHSNGYGGRLPG